ncbi:MAG: mechanosensitive ion channel family protein [Polyangiaceae bacterium]|nr:mechanosensitive ion channel family protein [Polyangiaceae bacterium]
MSWLTDVVAEAKSAGTLWLLVLVVLNALLARPKETESRRIIAAPAVLFGLHLVLLPIAGYFRARGAGAPGYTESRLPLLVFSALSAVMSVGAILFTVLLPRLRLRVPRILQDVVIGAAAIVAVFTVASRSGVNLSGLIATSAVLTAVIGLSLQDTLGNILSGLALQTDDSIHVGDWVKIGDVSGRVVEIRWRYTAVETRNWETVIFPNALLVKGQVTVLGRRQGQPTQWRRWVWFNVDFRFPPSDVIAAVTDALRSAPIDHVAADPAPNCILMDFHESYGRYAVRYWLTDLAADDPTDSAVRTRIYFALKRADLPLSIPAHAIFVTEQTAELKQQKSSAEQDRRLQMLSGIGMFAKLSAEEREALAGSLRYAPFAAGETMTRQGAEAHWLYIIASGETSVRVDIESEGQKEVARLRAGDFFGERSLLTGEPRSATIVALTRVECWRLDRAAFQELLSRRPEIAEEVAEVLAARQTELERARENLSAEAATRLAAQTKTDLVDKIRRFFRIETESLPPASKKG